MIHLRLDDLRCTIEVSITKKNNELMKDILSEIIANKHLKLTCKSRLFLSNNYRKVSADLRLPAL